jgi:hypothetical protein
VGFLLVLIAEVFNLETEIWVGAIIGLGVLGCLFLILRFRRGPGAIEAFLERRIALPRSAVFAACEKAAACVPALKDVQIDHKDTSLYGYMDPTWSTTGESLAVTVRGVGASDSVLQVVSRTEDPRVLTDYGRNSRNCEEFMALALSFLGAGLSDTAPTD